MATILEKISLPKGWEVSQDSDGNIFYIDHNTKTTQWDPPETVSNVVNVSGIQESEAGSSSGSNTTCLNQSSSGSSTIHETSFESEEAKQLKSVQAKMILKYLLAVKEDFKSKNEITETLKKRLELAGSESTSLKQLLTSATTSPTSHEKLVTEKEGMKLGPNKLGFNVSFLTKQYLDSQKRVQMLKEELASRRIEGELKFNQCIGHLLNQKSPLLLPSSIAYHTSPLPIQHTNTQSYSEFSRTQSDSAEISASSLGPPAKQDDPVHLENRLLELSKHIEDILVKLAPLQPHSDHDRLSVIQEKENLLAEMLQCERNLESASATSPAAAPGRNTTYLDLVQLRSSINSLRAEIAKEKEICNVVMSQRLSLLEQKGTMESECANIMEKLQNMSIASHSNLQSNHPSINEMSESYQHSVARSEAQVSSPKRERPALPRTTSGKSNNMYNQPVFLSDVSPDKDLDEPIFGVVTQSPSDQFARTSLRNKNISDSVEKHHLATMTRSQSFRNEVVSAYLAQRTQLAPVAVKDQNRESMYENIQYSPPESVRHFQRQSEEHNPTEAHYESVYEESANQVISPLSVFRHDRDDSGVAFYENISSGPRKKEASTSSDHKKSLSNESSSTSQSNYFASVKCKILIDIKFTVDHQLHVRLEELKDLTMLQSLSGLQFSVELYSLDDPNFSVCQCSGFLANNDFEIGGNLIVNEFMAFDLPYSGQIDSCFIRVIMFCRPQTSVSQSLPENFLAELNLSLASVFRIQQMSRFGSTSSWYQLSMSETSKLDYNALKSTAAGGLYPNLSPPNTSLNVYDPVYTSQFVSRDFPVVHPRDNSRMSMMSGPMYRQSDLQHVAQGRPPLPLPDSYPFPSYPQFGASRNYHVAHYSVKNTTVARLQPLSESQSSMYSSSGHSHFSPPSSGSNNSGGGGVVGIASLSGASFRDLMMVEPLVTSDEGYDERAVDCDSMSSLGSSEFRGGGLGNGAFRRSATFCQSARTYSSFNSHLSTLEAAAANNTAQQLCKLNRSESDSATQHYLLKPKQPPPPLPHHSHYNNDASRTSSPVGYGEQGSPVYGEQSSPNMQSSSKHPSTTLGSRFKRNAVERMPSKLKYKMAPGKYSTNQQHAAAGPTSATTASSNSSRFGCVSPPMGGGGGGSSSGGRVSQVSPTQSVVANIAANVRRKLNNNTTSSNNNGSG